LSANLHGTRSIERAVHCTAVRLGMQASAQIAALNGTATRLDPQNPEYAIRLHGTRAACRLRSSEIGEPDGARLCLRGNRGLNAFDRNRTGPAERNDGRSPRQMCLVADSHGALLDGIDGLPKTEGLALACHRRRGCNPTSEFNSVLRDIPTKSHGHGPANHHVFRIGSGHADLASPRFDVERRLLIDLVSPLEWKALSRSGDCREHSSNSDKP